MPTTFVRIVFPLITKLELVLFDELVPQLFAPTEVEAVTVNGVVLPELVPLVVIVRVDVGAAFVTVVGLNEATDPDGSEPLKTKPLEVQVPLPANVAVIV